MAVVKERYGARRADGRQATREYFITEATDENSARAAMLVHADCPATVTIGGIVYTRDLEACGVEEVHTTSADGTTIGSGLYIGGAAWKSPVGTYQPVGNFQLSFDISGQSTRITHSRSTVNSYVAAGKVKPNFKQAINVGSDGTVEGTDILVPYFTYTLTKTYSNATISGGWVLTAAQIVGSVNNATYQGFAAGELLLTRVSGQQRQDGSNDWDVTFAMAVSFNESSLSIGDITGISKDGWDYLWVYYEETLDTTNNRVNKIPIAAYVERVYRRKDYTGLAI